MSNWYTTRPHRGRVVYVILIGVVSQCDIQVNNDLTASFYVIKWFLPIESNKRLLGWRESPCAYDVTSYDITSDVKFGILVYFKLMITWRVLGIDWFDQESVHRCSLGYSTYLGLDFWIRHQLFISWGFRCQFLRIFDILKKSWNSRALNTWNFDP